MPTATLYRLSGLAVIVGMAIVGIASVLYSREGGVALYQDPLVPVDSLAKLFGSLAFLLGFPGLYAAQAARAGRLGLVGFVLGFAGLAVLELSTDTIYAFVGPMLARREETWFLLEPSIEQHLGTGFTVYFLLTYVVVVVGFVAFGIATARAGVYPRWTGIWISVGTVSAILLAPLVLVPTGPFRLDRVGVLVFSVAFAACGWQLLRRDSSRY